MCARSQQQQQQQQHTSELPSAWYRCSLGEAITAEKSRSLSACSASVYALVMVACDCG